MIPHLLKILESEAELRGVTSVRETCQAFLRMKSAPGTKVSRRPIPWRWVQDAILRQKLKCNRCGKLFENADRKFIHGDHIIALAQGGKHAQVNIQALHAECNLSKGANDLVREGKLTGKTILEQLQP